MGWREGPRKAVLKVNEITKSQTLVPFSSWPPSRRPGAATGTHHGLSRSSALEQVQKAKVGGRDLRSLPRSASSLVDCKKVPA